MCGRFTLFPDSYEALGAMVGAALDPSLAEQFRPRYNTAPMQRSWIVRPDREARTLDYARWGLVNHWAKDNKRASMQINARAETVHERPAYRAAFKSRRCLVPASGFYEWSGPKGDRQPHFIHPVDGGLWLFAGLFETWSGTDGAGETTFTIITTDANDVIAPIHDRMPVMLDSDAADQWLFAPDDEADRLRSLLVPAPAEGIAIQAANRAVGSVKHDGPELLTA